MSLVGGALAKFREKADREGFTVAAGATARVARDTLLSQVVKLRNDEPMQFVDVLFINGCAPSVPHPIRYRVDHQMQQLEAAGITCDRVEASALSLNLVGRARSFVIFRCPYNDAVGDFIRVAKSLNKRVYFDIDDLVIDTRYTDAIPFLATMSPQERAGYDEGVRLMGKTLRACGRAITTTDALARELAHYVDDVFVNRNVASEEMLHYSEQALFERDVLPSLAEGQVPHAQRRHWRWANERRAQRADTLTIGYFSGSITHNDDFELVIEPIVEVMRERENVRLLIVGLLDIPAQLADLSERITTLPFIDWRKLPRVMADVDINIAPLAPSVFNEAKSENKWVEAALVKVPTIASNVGAFAQMIDDGVTGILCDDASAWASALRRLLDSAALRQRIGAAAYAWAHEHALAVSTGHDLARHLRGSEAPNCMFVLPSLNLSGGILVALRHACIMSEAGCDVSVVNVDIDDETPWVDAAGVSLPVLRIRSRRNQDYPFLFRGRVDQFVSTMWLTLSDPLSYPNRDKVRYLVQGFETDFYAPADPNRTFANATYERADIDYLTISLWCRNWLRHRFGRVSRYCPNGIDTRAFAPVSRSWEGRIRVLIEGDCAVEHKNVDEAFRIADLLDPTRFEIWYLSYNGTPKETYRVDHFLHKVPYAKVASVYQQCHVLLKTSRLESFSYPPLEMMATGGAVVVAPIGGNVEYIRDGENCLTYELGDVRAAADAIERLATDGELRERLRIGGIKTAASRDWKALVPQVLALYEA